MSTVADEAKETRPYSRREVFAKSCDKCGSRETEIYGRARVHGKPGRVRYVWCTKCGHNWFQTPES